MMFSALINDFNSWVVSGHRQSRHWFVPAILLVLVFPYLAAAEAPKQGDKAPTSIVATFMSGGWIDKQKNACPVLANRDEARIAIFSKTSGDAVMKLVQRMDTLVAEHKRLKSSFLFVSHENQPTPSEEEWNEQFETLKRQVTTHGIKNLAAGLMIRLPETNKPTRARRLVGVFEKGDVVMMLVAPMKGTYGSIKEVVSLNSAELTEEQIDQVVKQMKAATEAL
jgi:hypothetical protein